MRKESASEQPRAHGEQKIRRLHPGRDNPETAPERIPSILAKIARPRGESARLMPGVIEEGNLIAGRAGGQARGEQRRIRMERTHSRDQIGYPVNAENP